MTALSWLHLTDLHQGLPGQRWLWPSVKDAFYDDLKALHDMSGPWDLVLFTGDLSQSGNPDEFKRLGVTLDKLWEHLRSLGSTPTLVTVPGNHDLVRPGMDPTVRSIRQWHSDADLREEFWSSPDNAYRRLVDEVFGPYKAFASSRPFPPSFEVKHGLLPGDVSLSFEKGGMSVAIVGLNSAFLQLTGGDYMGKLELDPRQLHAVTDPDDPTGWVRRHDLALLLTHHPTTWLHERAREVFHENVAPAGLFFAHLFGHMHEGTSRTESVAGAKRQRSLQGSSLFGLESWGDGTTSRIHGYMAARYAIGGRRCTFKLWPRISIKTKAGSRKMAPDYEFEVDCEGATLEEIEVKLSAARPAPSFDLYDALSRSHSLQFDQVVSLLAISAQDLPPPTSPQSARALALVELAERLGRLEGLRHAIERVGVRSS